MRKIERNVYLESLIYGWRNIVQWLLKVKLNYEEKTEHQETAPREPIVLSYDDG